MFQTLCESYPLSISGMSIKDVAARPFVAKCLISIGRNLSFSLLLPVVAKPNHLYKPEEKKVDFKSDIASLAKFSDKICVVLVQLQEYFFTIWNQGTCP